MSGEHAFVDETKDSGLVVVTLVTGPAGLDVSRAAMRALLLRGQSHLHFTNERDDRRGLIVRAITQLDVRIDVYDATGCNPRQARDRTMDLIVADLAASRAAWLVIERDDSLAAAERRVLATAVRRHGVEGRLQYRHVPKRSEPLLWAADAAAWCWTHKGWRERITPKIGKVTIVD